jgi:hypothetical protein
MAAASGIRQDGAIVSNNAFCFTPARCRQLDQRGTKRVSIRLCSRTWACARLDTYRGRTTGSEASAAFFSRRRRDSRKVVSHERRRRRSRALQSERLRCLTTRARANRPLPWGCAWRRSHSRHGKLISDESGWTLNSSQIPRRCVRWRSPKRCVHCEQQGLCPKARSYPLQLSCSNSITLQHFAPGAEAGAPYWRRRSV